MGAKAGSTAAVAALLDAGADINWSDDMERSALGEAAIEGHLPVVKLLLRELRGGGWAESYQPQCMNDHRSELAMEGCLWLKWRALFCLASSAGCGFRLRMRWVHAGSQWLRCPGTPASLRSFASSGMLPLGPCAGRGANVRHRDSSGWTALHCSCRQVALSGVCSVLQLVQTKAYYKVPVLPHICGLPAS